MDLVWISIRPVHIFGGNSNVYSSMLMVVSHRDTCLLPLGGQVGQTTAGHQSELFLALLAITVLVQPSFAKPGEVQAQRHGGDRTRLGDFSEPVHQLAAGTSYVALWIACGVCHSSIC